MDEAEVRARGQRLQALRRAHRPRISQEQMAELVKVSPETIGNYERGVSWDVGTVSLILEVLGLNAAVLDEQTPRSEFADRMIDQEILDEFSDDVLSAILGVGVWLHRYEGDPDRFREERRRLIRYMLDRDRA